MVNVNTLKVCIYYVEMPMMHGFSIDSKYVLLFYSSSELKLEPTSAIIKKVEGNTVTRHGIRNSTTFKKRCS
jgi:hypothetical protein